MRMFRRRAFERIARVAELFGTNCPPAWGKVFAFAQSRGFLLVFRLFSGKLSEVL